MKTYGEGKICDDSRREASLRRIIGSKNVNCMTIGMTTPEQIDNNVFRMMNIVKKV